jgi:hypothetical protein
MSVQIRLRARVGGRGHCNGSYFLRDFGSFLAIQPSGFVRRVYGTLTNPLPEVVSRCGRHFLHILIFRRGNS